LDELGLDRQAVLELKLKSGVASEDSAVGKATRAESRSKASDRSVRPTRVDAREAFHVECGVVVVYVDLLGAEAEVTLRKARGHAAA
jgi:hypothetical protein